MAQQRFPIVKRGNTWRHRFTFELTGGITACDMVMMWKRRKSDLDSEALVTIDDDLIGGITKVSATEADFEVGAAVTATLQGPLVGGIQFKLPNGDVIEIEEADLVSTIHLEGDVVRATP